MVTHARIDELNGENDGLRREIEGLRWQNERHMRLGTAVTNLMWWAQNRVAFLLGYIEVLVEGAGRVVRRGS